MASQAEMLCDTDEYAFDGRPVSAAPRRPAVRLGARHARLLGYGAFLIFGAVLLIDVAIGGGALQWLRDGGAAQSRWIAALERSYGR